MAIGKILSLGVKALKASRKTKGGYGRRSPIENAFIKAKVARRNLGEENRMIIKASAPLATGIVGAKLSHDPSKNYRDTGPLAQLGKKMGMRGETFGSPPPSKSKKK
jgi:hypothetical protein